MDINNKLCKKLDFIRDGRELLNNKLALYTGFYAIMSNRS
jgi:hypothetical protein